ncbi:MAG: M1 family aminopeptidase [Blastocatellia bacterium]|nr:M1 family aminopeptidase [Blastocatellia bacterium]
MFLEIFLFEIKFRLKRASTYVYFAIWFFMAFFSVSVRQFGPGSTGGKVFVNSPYVIVQLVTSLMVFGLVVVSGIFGTSIYRDFEEGVYQMFFTKPLRKLDYLGGRWLGSFVITVLIFSGMVLGLLIGKFMPWADPERLMPINLWFHLQPFLLFGVTEIFFTGALFFMVGALTRNIVFVYLQGVVFLGLYLVLLVLTGSNSDFLQKSWPAVIDPLGIVTAQKITRYWTVAEKNSLTIPLAGEMLYNRLLWLGVGVAALIALYRFFPFSAEALTAKRAKKVRVEEEDEAVAPRALPVFSARQQFGGATTRAQFATLTRLRILSIVREIPFIAIVLIGVAFVFIGGWQVGRFFDTPVLPVTYLMVDMVKGQFMLFLLVITTLYAGELVWKERGLKFDQIHDALPMPGWLNFTSKLTALTVVQFAMLVVMMLSGVTLQALQGYFNFEWNIYFKDFFLILLPNLIQYSALALFLQTMLPNKFLGHAVFIGIFIALTVISRYGFENTMYQFGELPAYTYSDMNGYGHFVKPIFWFTLYWSMFAGILAVAATAFSRRGADLAWRARAKQAASQFRMPLRIAGALFAAGFVAVGAYVHYNTHRLNKYEDGKMRRRLQATYEKKYKQYEGLPQPKITDVEIRVEIHPERRAFSGSGRFTLVNKTEQPIPAIHILDGGESLRKLTFDRAVTQTLDDRELRYAIYQFAEPLKPKETLRLDFEVGYENPGFRDGGEKAEFAHNGTFFDSTYFPSIGYSRNFEMGDDDERRDEGLPPQADLPRPDAAGVRMQNLFSQDADWIRFKATVGTSSDQIAVAPGYLQREWTENGRRYFAYDMGETKIQNFYSFISGRYAVQRDKWTGPQGEVAIEVYYDPKHPYNVARMIDSSKKGLDYFSKNFGPYQFRQYRILEFPRYRGFAQSFPNTIPYSEGIGFIAHGTEEEDLDAPFYVTAHELAHQWWGHQVIGCYAQGSNMLSETLAQYSALMLMEKEEGPANIRRYLKYELDRYLRGRSAERRKEDPLGLVQRGGYIWYNKGSLVMYALKDYLGEDRLNAAIRNYAERVRFQEPPYTTSLEFVAALREAAPEEMKHLLTDLFETITLFDNRAVEATWRETPEKKYLVRIKVDARKLRADDLGAEKEIEINDLIDIGIFEGEKKDEKPLFLEKRRLTRPQMEFEITVDRMPTRAGIDPYNKLIDRKPDDNVIVVGKAE